MYDLGRGVREDDAEAAHWYRRAAEQGLAKAQNQLGIMYSFGRGVREDEEEAVRWFRRADEQGLDAARINLSLMDERIRARWNAGFVLEALDRLR